VLISHADTRRSTRNPRHDNCSASAKVGSTTYARGVRRRPQAAFPRRYPHEANLHCHRLSLACMRLLVAPLVAATRLAVASARDHGAMATCRPSPDLHPACDLRVRTAACRPVHRRGHRIGGSQRRRAARGLRGGGGLHVGSSRSFAHLGRPTWSNSRSADSRSCPRTRRSTRRRHASTRRWRRFDASACSGRARSPTLGRWHVDCTTPCSDGRGAGTRDNQKIVVIQKLLEGIRSLP